ncbi:histidine kinase dimerization/phosphoacceptor domain -containing protein [Dyadobacter sp. CY343]|uniref:tetratricopeptide repeat-containing sensor histidine kinase n=1 Tax=Dyadobacter sp. CY343 TaxID=2907299 RepID=UPI001F3F9A20|nr:sensor histidine kinase [Dyadobacter sp. CY343]MCE7060221.1 sensor histidine kinase [Dyadobacter sp. CY343]
MRPVFKLCSVFCLITAILFATHSVAQDAEVPLSTLEKQLRETKNNDSLKANILIQLGYHYLLKPGSDSTDMQKAGNYANMVVQISKGIRSELLNGEAILLISQIFKERGNKKKALQLLNYSIAIFRKVKAPINEGKALMEKRHYFDPYDGIQINDRIKVVAEAIELFRKGGENKWQGDGYLELGDLYSLLREDQTSIQYLKRALEVYRLAKYKRLHGVYDLLGALYSKYGMYEEGVENGLLAVKTALAVGDTSSALCAIYNRLGLTYYRAEDYINAYVYFKKSISIAVGNKDPAAIAIVSVNLVKTLHRLQNNNLKEHITYLTYLESVINDLSPNRIYIPATISVLYARQGDLFKSKLYLDKIFNYLKEHEIAEVDKRWVNEAAYYYYFAKKNYSLAEKHAEKFKSRCVTREELQKYNLMAYEVAYAQGKFKSAADHYVVYKATTDSIYEYARKKQIDMFNVRFEVEKKDADIKLKAENIRLLTRENDLNKVLLAKTKITNNITIAAVLLLLALIFLLYNRWQTNRKSSIIIAEKNKFLELVVREKEWLLKEIHHRVKNNLQTVMSLLESQSAYLKNDALSAIKDSQHRVQAMSLIHQKLYLTDNVTTINMQTYIREVISYLQDSFDTRQRIRFQFSLEDIDLDITQAIPIGLILNETITNAIKYAFPDGKEGLVRVSTKEPNDGFFELLIEDNGVGLPSDFETKKLNSLGIRLMYGLSNEIGGKLHIVSNQGTSVSVTFEIEKIFRRATNIGVEETVLEYEN